MLIITETKNGSAFPKNVFTCQDEANFINRIRETQLQNRSGEELVETVDQACEYLNECYAQRTEIITQSDFEHTESWCTKIDDCARQIGWLVDTEDESED